MASEAAADSSGMLQDTDFEELEVTETDVALLRELLEEEEEEEEEELELEKDNNKIMSAKSDAGDHHKHGTILELNEELNYADGFDCCCWPEMVDQMKPISPLPVDENMAWYVDDNFGSHEFEYCSIDYSQLYMSSGVSFEEETAYGCLWQD